MQTDFDRMFLQEAKCRFEPIDLEMLEIKARNFDILMGASKREIEAMWDVMNATGCPVQPLIDALERRQK